MITAVEFTEDAFRRFRLNFDTIFFLKTSIKDDERIEKAFIHFVLLKVEGKNDLLQQKMEKYGLTQDDVGEINDRFESELGEELEHWKIASDPVASELAEQEKRAEQFATVGTHITGGFVGGLIAGLVFNLLHWVIMAIFGEDTGGIVSKYVTTILSMIIGAIGIKIHLLGTLAFFGGACLVMYVLYAVFGLSIPFFLVPGR